MKKAILIIVLALLSSTLMAQTKSPKQHVFYDTVKTVKERIEYAPDTIPVYFKEVAKIAYKCIGCGDTIVEKWTKGFIIWQTYRRYNSYYSDSLTFSTGGYFTINNSPDAFYKREYEPSESLPGIFLYEDKTKCKNLVIYSIKR